MNPSVYTASGTYFGTLAATTTVAGPFPQFYASLILTNPNSDCTSSMICKDGFLTLFDVKALVDLTTATGVSTIQVNWNTGTNIDQTVNSGWSTSAANTESYTRIEASTEDLCKEVWTLVLGGAPTMTGKACVSIVATIERPFTADDPVTNMNINADPNNSQGLLTNYKWKV